MNCAPVSTPVLRHLAAMNAAMAKPAKHIVHCIPTDTQPCMYANDPQATNVPAEKKLMNKDSPLIHHGTAPPPAKKVFMFFPAFANDMPAARTPRVKTTITM